MTLSDIIKNCITLSDKADDKYVKYLGNRVTVASYVAASYGFAFYVHGIFTRGSLGILESYFGGVVLMASKFFAEMYTNYGQETFKYYKRTEKHIKKSGKLKKRYLKRLIDKELSNDRLVGYCEIQGAYLAARKYNQLDVFNEVKKKQSKNIIPNF